MQPSIHTSFSFAPPRYTYDDYKNWSDEWELIEGYAYSLMPSAKFRHQVFNSRFSRRVGNLLAAKSCTCEPVSDVDWIINNETIVRPDTMIVCDQNVSDYITTAPPLIMEIGSTSTYLKDKNIKFKLYETNGVKYYLLADTEKEKVEIFELINGNYNIKLDSLFCFAEGCEIELSFEGLWRKK